MPFPFDWARTVLLRKSTATAATIMLTFFMGRPPSFHAKRVLVAHTLVCALFRIGKTQTKTAQAEACATGLRRTQFLRALLTNFYLSGPPGQFALPPLKSPATCSGSPF